jgi:glycosidase
MKKTVSLAAAILIAMSACKPKTETASRHTDWSSNATIYEVNVRQFTPEGTFKAFEKQLPRLSKMGVGIVWLMPVNPIGVQNRKGKLGSYYAVKDYLAINPEFGGIQDLKSLVATAHQLGMKVIIDWVANHTAWDNELLSQHPEWYKKDSTGKIIPPVADWADVAALDYSNDSLRAWMTRALCYWVKETDIDGYRCDVAGMVPISFWNKAVPEIKKIKPVFMLAEWETPEMHDTAFDATYSWDLYKLANEIAAGKKNANDIDSLYSKEMKKYSPDAFRMRFTSNHDENSWNGTEYERLNGAALTFAVFTFTFPGIPLIYTGQESAMNKRLRFFDKDTVNWGNYSLEGFYTTLCNLKKSNKSLLNGEDGGKLFRLKTDANDKIYAFTREKEGNKVMVMLNLTASPVDFKLADGVPSGSWQPVFGKATPAASMNLKPWEYLVWEVN